MTLDEVAEHGRAWLEAGWVWAPGQVALIDPGMGESPMLPSVVVFVHEGRPYFERSIPTEGFCMAWFDPPEILPAVPDLRDPGTRGHALAQVSASLGLPVVVIQDPRDHWAPVVIDNGHIDRSLVGKFVFDSEADALLAAMRIALRIALQVVEP